MRIDQAIKVIRGCLTADRYRVTFHFSQRMDERGLFWGDILAIAESPTRARADGFDDRGRSRWILRGVATDGLEIEFVCVLDRDEQGHLVVLITAYWED